ncbi:glycoside hydrolase family 3 protein [Thozetella sp. PMI_491]|nr:glycoside hydrolase family 3 protein [Thozetella sp. PMI_491]
MTSQEHLSPAPAWSSSGTTWIPSSTQPDDKHVFLDGLISKMSAEELAFQLVVVSGNRVVGPKSDHSLYDDFLHLAPDAGIGVMFNWYPTHPSQFNALQALNLEKSRNKIPLMAFGECIHSVYSNRQTVFPQALALSTSFDTNLIRRVARALGAEARSVGIHAGFAPVLDLAKEPRYGRNQESFGEDFVLTSHMGVAYCSGLSKDGNWSDSDALIPVIKHFAGHASPSGGLHSNAYLGRGRRELLSETLVPFKSAVELGGVRGVMMAYTAVDDLPAHIDPFLYKQLDEWGYDGFVISDWSGVEELMTGHQVAKCPADAIKHWLNSGGGMYLYDFTPDVIVTTTTELVKNGEVKRSTLEDRVRKVLEVKYDLGLFHNPYLPEDVDSDAITISHIPLALEAARKSIVLLENKEEILPVNPTKQKISKIAVIGPFADTFNFGTYTGTWGANPADRATTIRQGLLGHVEQSLLSSISLVSAWGANTWQYNAQYPIPGYHLVANGSPGGLHASYYHDMEFRDLAFQVTEMPNRDWGLYPPNGLHSNNFSAIWEGDLKVPVSSDVDGWIGVAVSRYTTARLFIDGKQVAVSESTETGNILPQIEPYSYTATNGTRPPPGGAEFCFKPNSTHHIRIEYQTSASEAAPRLTGVKASVQLWWNLVDRNDAVGQAENVASAADLIVLAVGAAWNSDAENGDRATMTLSDDQTKLSRAIFAQKKPVILVLQGGRPFAIPEFYQQSAAVLSMSFLGQAAGQAIADVIFGQFNPSGRLSISVPYDVGSLPSYYNQRTTKPARHIPYYLDIPQPVLYSFGYGLTYTTFSQSLQNAKSTSSGRKKTIFSHGDIIEFSVSVTNNGSTTGSHVPQIYLLRRQGASVTMPNKQLVAFTRLDVIAQETIVSTLKLEVDRYLPVIDREFERVLEAGEYHFVLATDGSLKASIDGEVTMRGDQCSG